MESKSYIGNRFEFKYRLDPAKAHAMECFIQQVGLIPDEYSEKHGSYLVNSYYFDTPTLGDYREKDASILTRKKMRARTYANMWNENPEHIWLEIKKKNNMYIKKTRVEIDAKSMTMLKEGQTQSLGSHLQHTDQERAILDEFLYHYRRQLYRPSVIIKYQRSAYMTRFTEPVRVTFDKNIEACGTTFEREERMMRDISRGKIIMEVKFAQKLPWWFSDLLSRFDIRRDDFSKYRNAIATLRGYQHIPIDK